MVKDDKTSVPMYVHVDGVPSPVNSSTAEVHYGGTPLHGSHHRTVTRRDYSSIEYTMNNTCNSETSRGILFTSVCSGTSYSEYYACNRHTYIDYTHPLTAFSTRGTTVNLLEV